MLIYNSKKEFLGIDETDLSNLGFTSFSQLRAEAADFADFFVKTPGFIHNFKHVHWIDFITCADSAEPPKVIIHAHDKNYRCNLHITTAYLTDNQTAKAYLVNLQNLRELSVNEISDYAADISNKPATKPVEIIKDKVFEAEAEIKAPAPIIETNSALEIVEDQYDNDTLSAPLDVSFDTDEGIEEKIQKPEESEPEIKEETLQIEQEIVEVEVPQTEDLEDVFESDYVFNPQIASDELGLPIDLIEEFIDDFIAQAKEFKADLYESLEDEDIDNVKILSHKLKGVAANLRIEDAFEVLTTINTSRDTSTIRKNLNHLYIIVAKLAGEDVEAVKQKPVPQATTMEDDEDNFILDFKEDEILVPSTPKKEEKTEEPIIEEIKDEVIELATEDIITISDNEVPDKIDVAELADDDFLNNSPLEIDEKSLVLDIETIKEEELAQDISIEEELPDLIQNEIEEPKPEEIKITYNKQDVANEIGLDKESFDELFDDYLADTNNLCSSIQTAISEKNSDRWKEEAIKLKGMSDNMRINDFTNELETLLQTSESDEAKQALEKIKNFISQITSMEA